MARMVAWTLLLKLLVCREIRHVRPIVLHGCSASAPDDRPALQHHDIGNDPIIACG